MILLVVSSWEAYCPAVHVDVLYLLMHCEKHVDNSQMVVASTNVTGMDPRDNFNLSFKLPKS